MHAARVATVLERTDWLRELREMASNGRIALRVAAELPPEQAAEGHRLMDAGGLRGRAVIVFGSDYALAREARAATSQAGRRNPAA